jgi:hypothetical protein
MRNQNLNIHEIIIADDNLGTKIICHQVTDFSRYIDIFTDLIYKEK